MITKDILQIQNRIGILVSAVGFTVTLINIILLITARGKGFLQAVFHPSVLLVFCFSLLIFLTRKNRGPYVRYLQVFIFLVNAAVALMDEYDSFAGMGFIILALILAYRYGLLETRTKTKLVLLSAFILVILELAIIREGGDHIGSSINILMYLAFFITITYLIYSSEINRILYSEKEYKKSLHEMEEEKRQLARDIESHHRDIREKQSRIDDLEDRIQRLTPPDKTLDLGAFGITPKEEEVIREFCLNSHLTNKEIAHNLGLTTGTVKQHFSRIFRKMGIRSRQELLDKCRWNF